MKLKPSSAPEIGGKTVTCTLILPPPLTILHFIGTTLRIPLSVDIESFSNIKVDNWSVSEREKLPHSFS